MSNEHNGQTYPNLISLSYRTGTVLEESWHEVVGDKKVEISQISGIEPQHTIIKRARKCINKDIKYNLLTFNCEHFVRYAHGLPIESIQVQKVLSGAIIGAASCMLLPKYTALRFALLATTGAVASLKNSLDKL